MNHEHLNQREQAYERIRQRHIRQKKQRARRKRRMLLLLICAFLLITGIAACQLIPRSPDGPNGSSQSSDEPQGGHGDVINSDVPVPPDAPVIEPPKSNYEDYADVDITIHEDDSPLLQELKTLAADDIRIKKILAHLDIYSEDMLYVVLKSPEAIDYIASYVEKKDQYYTIDLSKEASSSQIPLLLQWDERWGYAPYGSGLIGWTGCGPTCMSMLALYYTGNDAYDPATCAKWAEENHYYSTGSGTSWTFFGEGSSHFGLAAEELPLVKQYMINALEEGRAIVCSMGPGDFTTGGHYIVLTGYVEDLGFTVNDPNSPLRSTQYWPYEQIESQINNLWAIGKA